MYCEEASGAVVPGGGGEGGVVAKGFGVPYLRYSMSFFICLVRYWSRYRRVDLKWAFRCVLSSLRGSTSRKGTNSLAIDFMTASLVSREWSQYDVNFHLLVVVTLSWAANFLFTLSCVHGWGSSVSVFGVVVVVVVVVGRGGGGGGVPACPRRW